MTELFDAMLLRTAVARLVPLRHSRAAMQAERLRLAAELWELDVVCSVPASWSKRKAAEALHGVIRPTKKPDADNVLKAVCDGINGVVWHDDTRAVDVTLRKRYGPVPGVWVFVRQVPSAPVHEQVEMMETAA